MTPSYPADKRPSAKQLAYLRSLAARTGQTFAYPRTAAHASAEIRRLKSAAPSSRIERAVERKLNADAIASGPEDSSAVTGREINRLWILSDLEGAVMTTATVTETQREATPSASASSSGATA